MLSAQPRWIARPRALLDAALRGPIRRAVATSLVINLLSLVTPVYMTQVFDRVLSSRSEATLIAITAVTLIIIVLLAAFDLLRNIGFARAGAELYAELEARVFAACRRLALAGGSGRRARPLDDLEQVRSFLGSPTPGALFDMLFVPLFVIVLFLIHPLLGIFTLGLVGVIVGLALMNRAAMAQTTDRSIEHLRRAADLAEAHLRAVEPALVMGFAARGEARAAAANREAVLAQVAAAATTGSITSVIKGLRQASQIIIMAFAAWLALEGAVTMGSIIAASILFARALAPIDQLVGAWRLLFQVRSAWERLTAISAQVPETSTAMPLPAPSGAICLENVSAAAPEGRTAILRQISFALAAGESLGIIGPSGSGKSTLARVMLGAWPVLHGTVRIDGADLAQLDLSAVGDHFGYLPQAVELLPGTVAENIRRFGDDAPAAVVATARLAGAHEMILALPQGYDTPLGGRGFALSGGQKQRVALARALYGEPRLVVLDEPDAGLDRDGEATLLRAVAKLRERGTTVVVVAHRPALVHSLDKLLVLVGGQVQRYGSVAEIMPQVTATQIRAVQP